MTPFENVPADCSHEDKEYKRGRWTGILLMIVCRTCGAILFMRPQGEEKKK